MNSRTSQSGYRGSFRGNRFDLQGLEPRVLLSAGLQGHEPQDAIVAMVEPEAGGLIIANISASIDQITFVNSTISGSAARGKLSVFIQNTSDSALPKGAKVDIQLFARPTGGGNDVLLASRSNASISNLGAGASKATPFNFGLPVDIPAGDYTFVAVVVDPLADESTTSNTNGAFTVEPAVIDLTPAVGSFKLPTSLISGSSANGTVQVTVTNTANVALSKAASAEISVALRPVGASDDSQDIVIGMGTAKIGGMKPNTAKSFNVKATIAGIADGQYNLVAVMDPQNVTETDTANNSVVDDDVFTVAPAQSDLAIVSTKFPINNGGTLDSGASGKVEVIIKNIGTDTANGNITINILGSTSGDVQDGEVIGTATLNNASIKPGKTVKVLVDITAASVQDVTSYTSFVQVDFSGNDADLGNNTQQDIGFVVSPSILDLLGDMTFTQTTFVDIFIQKSSTGNMVASIGGPGTYAYSAFTTGPVASTGFLELFGAFTGGGPAVIELHFKSQANRPISLHGKTLRLTNSKTANSLGDFLITAFGPQTPNTTGFFEFI